MGVAENTPKMGRVRTKTVKKAARVIIEKYYTKLTLDFHTNKRIIEEVALIPSKPLRNKIAGFITHLMKRLQRSTVRGISIKLQGEEGQLRARRLRPRAGHHRGRLGDQGDAQDDGLPEHPRPPAPEQQGRLQQELEQELIFRPDGRCMYTCGRMSRRRQ